MTDETGLSWAEGQLADARVQIPVGKAVLALLKVWEELEFPNDKQRDSALEIFSSLAKNEAVVVETEEQWVPVHVGFNVKVGNTVRVRKDAFEGEPGRIHNGRVGRVLAKRSGDIIIRTTDGKEPYLDGAHYPPSALELRVG